MGQIGFISSLVMISLFSIAIIGFAFNFAIENESSIDLADNENVSSLFNTMRDNMTDTLASSSNSTTASILKTKIEPGSSTGTSIGPFTITPLNVLPVVYSILRIGYSELFGTDSGFNVFMTALISLLGTIMILYAWHVLLGGKPD